MRRDTPGQPQGWGGCSAAAEGKREDFSPALKEGIWLSSLLPGRGLAILTREVGALDRACERQERLAVTGDCKDQCLRLQRGLLNHPGKASNSFTLTHHMWDTVRVSRTNVLWEIQTRKCWPNPALCLYCCCPPRTVLLSRALALPSRCGPAAWLPRQLVPPSAWSTRWPR